MKAAGYTLGAILRGALITLLFFARVTHAQRVESSLDVGGVALRYADTLNATAAAITPHVLADWGREIAEASGTFSQFTTRGWSAQGALSASLLTPPSNGVLGEIGGFAGGSARNDAIRTGEMLVNGRLHFVRPREEAFLGAATGRTWDGAAWRSVVLGEVGAALNYARGGAILILSPILINDSIKYTDSQLSLSLTDDKLELGALLGVRFGNQLTSLGTNAKSWGSLSAVAWMTPHVGIAASGGSYPIDPTQGFPGGRFVSLSVRVATGRSRAAQPVVGRETLPETETSERAAVVSGFTTERTGPGAVTFKINSPHAQVVEISGDFTNWVPVRLDPSTGGWWSTTLPMAPGKYQMNSRVDGGKWLVPAGLLSIVDEFGGTVGLLVVE